jgi:electron transfer flavoprotein alpha subunit
MSVNTWIVVAGDPAIGNLIETARSLGGQVTAAVVGPRAVADTVAAGGVDKVVWFGEPGKAPVEAFATAAADAIEAAPGVVLGASRASDRVLLGAVAARLQAPVLTAPSSVSADGDNLVVTRSTFAGIAEETVTVTGPVALLLDGGPIPVAIVASGSAPVEEVVALTLGMTVVETHASEFEEVDLGTAARVVGIGRGLKAPGDLAMIESLAKASGSEVACSRPLAEGLDWLRKDRYIGVSGQQIAPEVYFAIGISGQLQHMVGVRGAKTIVAINSDPNAPVFKEADYCLAGDLYKIVPALTDALK